MSLTAYIRYDSQGRIVPGGPIVTKTKPAVGNWQVVTQGTSATLVGQLRGFVKLDRYNKPLAGSLFLGKSKPATGKWLEVNATYEGAVAPTTTTTTSSSTSTTTSTTTIPGYTVGQQALGGVIAYILQPGDPGYDANVQHGLVTTFIYASSEFEWGCAGTDVSTSDAFGTGLSNTNNIIAACNTPGIAAEVCANLTEGGYSDWYLPSKDEIYKLYANNYTGALQITSSFGLTSSQLDSAHDWIIYFGGGYYYQDAKFTTRTMFPVRSF